jgi:predicted RNA-binding Zn ribbon-like protein
MGAGPDTGTRHSPVPLDLGPRPWTFLLDERPPAPGRLRLVQALANTVNLETGKDVIDTPPGLVAWLGEFDLLPADAPVLDSDVARARELREALRLLVRRNAEPDLDTAAAAQTVSRVAAAGRLTVEFSPDGTGRLHSLDPGVDGSLAAVAAGAFEAMANGTWTRLRACMRCHWASYDRSRNLSSRWCSMRYCGNRTKTRAYRRRRDAAC